MKVSSILVQPPSLAAQLGRANRAFSERIKETIQSEKEQTKEKKVDESPELKVQGLIDLLV